ncbi:hypothetical protein ACQKMD_08400 [Viridibacillus sp. NPDC096237]|uniref:hypothetical protein n=1 Tax=Viridibacillus sp. NPDC096237 TaxID=3390721 RepID=UPI003D034123
MLLHTNVKVKAIVATVFAKFYPERLYLLIISGITPEKPENCFGTDFITAIFQGLGVKRKE